MAQDEDDEMELRPVKPGKTFLFGPVDNMWLYVLPQGICVININIIENRVKMQGQKGQEEEMKR